MPVPSQVYRFVLVGLAVTLVLGGQPALAHGAILGAMDDGAPTLDASDPGLAAPPAEGPAAGTASGMDLSAEQRRLIWQYLNGVERPDLVGRGDPWVPIDVASIVGREADTGHESRIVMTCPEDVGATSVEMADRRQGDFTVAGCPMRIVDVPNPLGSPWLAVNPADPAHMAFFSLHGQVFVNGPTERSRLGQTMTTFTSSVYGVEWDDQPLNEGWTPRNSSGEFASGAFDRSGNVYVGYAWHLLDSKKRPEASEVRLYKAEPVTADRNIKDAYLWATDFVVENGTSSEVHLLRVDPYPFTNETTIENGTEDGNSTGNSPGNSTGNGTGDGNTTGRGEWPFVRFAGAADERTDRVVAIWPAVRDEEGEKTGYIDAAWSKTVANDEWIRLHEDERIGPCTETGRPVQFRGKVLVPCVVGPGYTARDRAHVGDIDIWSIDPYTGKTEHLSSTGINGGKPMLATTPSGYMTMIASGWDEDKEEGDVYLAWGWYGLKWLPLRTNLYPLFHRIAGDADTTDARVTAMELLPGDSTLVLVYHERQELTAPDADPYRFDAMNPPRPREYTKTIITMNECDGILAAAAVPLGNGMMSFHWKAYNDNAGTFNDVQDGLVNFYDPETETHYLAFALNDYGSIQYGWIDADAAGEYCMIGPPPMVPLAPALPQALQTGTGAGQLAGAAIGLLAAAMVAYLLTVKRRSAQSTAAEDR